MILEFSDPDREPSWVAVNDGVMGGRSRGGPEIHDGVLSFRGVLSLENNGGFSSIRTTDRPFDLSDHAGLHLRVRGDGRTYELRLATDARFRGSRISYCTPFATEPDTWIEVRIPFSDLRPGWRGQRLRGPALNLADIFEIGILLGDKRPGPFALQVDWIKTYDAP